MSKFIRLQYLGSRQDQLRLTKQEGLILINENQEYFDDEIEIKAWIEEVTILETLSDAKKLIKEIHLEIAKGRTGQVEKEKNESSDSWYDEEDERSWLSARLL